MGGLRALGSPGSLEPNTYGDGLKSVKEWCHLRSGDRTGILPSSGPAMDVTKHGPPIQTVATVLALVGRPGARHWPLIWVLPLLRVGHVGAGHGTK